MKRTGNTKRSGEGEHEESRTYSRGDTGLWDDGDLVRLWNEQLELIHNKRAMTGDDGGAADHGDGTSDEDPESDATDANEDEDEESDDRSSHDEGDRTPEERSRESEEMGCGRAFAALAHAASSAGAVGSSMGHAAAGNAVGVCPLPVAHLPAEVRALAVSFYAAGFEAGKFATLHKRGKRGRE